MIRVVTVAQWDEVLPTEVAYWFGPEAARGVQIERIEPRAQEGRFDVLLANGTYAEALGTDRFFVSPK